MTTKATTKATKARKAQASGVGAAKSILLTLLAELSYSEILEAVHNKNLAYLLATSNRVHAALIATSLVDNFEEWDQLTKIYSNIQDNIAYLISIYAPELSGCLIIPTTLTPGAPEHYYVMAPNGNLIVATDEVNNLLN